MSTPAQRSARAALDAARPAVARLNATLGGEDLAADLVEIWNAVESALRTLVGSSALAGQALIREARQRQLINFDLANSLAEFEAVHGRLQDTSYRPVDADVNSARDAYLKLDAALMEDTSYSSYAPGAPRPAAGAPAAMSSAAAAPTESIAPPVTPVSGRRRWMVPTIAAVVVVVLAVGGWALFGRGGSGSFDAGVDAYTKGQREVAVSDFNKAAREDSKNPMPHVYLARMAREAGNFSEASTELQLALEADPNNAIALREMGANLLQQGNNELARRFYVRAVTADPTDKSAQGYLGCSLARLGRQQEAQSFFTRAGPGPWTSCTPASATAQVPPGAAIPH